MWRLIAGCGYLNAPGDPLVEAHAGGQGHYPANTLAAFEHALAAGYPAIEFDLGMMADGELVLAHDPWLDGQRCTDLNDVPLTKTLWLADYTLDELADTVRCGGVPNPDFPDAAVVSEPLTAYTTLLDLLVGHPELTLHHDLKYDPALGVSAEAWPDALLPAWEAAALPNPWYVDSPFPELIRVFEAQGDIRTSLGWPTWELDKNQVGTVLAAEFAVGVGVESILAAVEDAGADSVGIYWQNADRFVVEDLTHRGIGVQVYAPETEVQLDDFCRWPLEAIITDYPERVPCWSL